MQTTICIPILAFGYYKEFVFMYGRMLSRVFFSLGKYLGPEWLSRKWCLLSSWRTSHTVFQMIFYPLEFLLRLAQQKGTRAWYCEPRQIPVAGEAMGPR